MEVAEPPLPMNWKPTKEEALACQMVAKPLPAYRKEHALEYAKYEKMIISKLWDDAENATLMLYADLKKKGKLSAWVLNNDCGTFEFWKKMNPNCSFMESSDWDAMFYYIDPNDGTPYTSLRVNRYKENGEKVIKNCCEQFGPEYCWNLEKDLKYLELTQTFKNLSPLEWDEQKIKGPARSIAKQYGKTFSDGDVMSCLHCAVRTNAVLNYLAVARKFCLRILSKDEQKQLKKDRKGYLGRMCTEYKIFEHIGNLEKLVNVVSGFIHELLSNNPTMKFGDPNWTKKMVENIEAFLEAEEDNLLRTPIFPSEYIKLKLKLAEETGIITKDEKTGCYVETYRDIILEEIDLHSAKLKLEKLWGSEVLIRYMKAVGLEYVK